MLCPSQVTPTHCPHHFSPAATPPPPPRPGLPISFNLLPLLSALQRSGSVPSWVSRGRPEPPTQTLTAPPPPPRGSTWLSSQSAPTRLGFGSRSMNRLVCKTLFPKADRPSDNWAQEPWLTSAPLLQFQWAYCFPAGRGTRNRQPPHPNPPTYRSIIRLIVSEISIKVVQKAWGRAFNHRVLSRVCNG